MAKKDVHVVPHEGGWAVRRENSDRASSIHPSQAEAIDAARRTAQRDHLELFVHGRDGRIRERDSHGHDPFPPRDKR